MHRNCLLVLAALMFAGCRPHPLPAGDPPEVRARNGVAELTLTAASDANGRDVWLYNGEAVQPAIRLTPGDLLNIHYVNALPNTPREPCDAGPCMNMTNLHFHGLTVSPKSPQDDVLDLMAMPGESIDYTLEIPRDHTPGLNWYHTHPHGESHRQVLDGLSGALVIEGIERYVPQVRDLRERVLVIRGVDIEHDPGGSALRSRVGSQSASCGANHELAERVFTVNGVVRPEVAIAAGEQQFWRIVNASADTYVDLELDGGAFERGGFEREGFQIVALDGMPLALHNPQRPMRRADHVLVPPAGRLEAIVTGRRDGGALGPAYTVRGHRSRWRSEPCDDPGRRGSWARAKRGHRVFRSSMCVRRRIRSSISKRSRRPIPSSSWCSQKTSTGSTSTGGSTLQTPGQWSARTSASTSAGGS